MPTRIANRWLIMRRRVTAVAAPAYTGPGDLTGWSSAYGYWGLRAYTAAKATALAAAIQIVDQVGAHATDIHVTASGAINLTEIAAFKTAWSPSTIQISKVYDQSGNGFDLTTVSGGGLPTLTENIINTTLPAMTFAAGNLISGAVAATAQAQPVSVGGVVKFTGNTGQIITDGTFGFQPMASIFASGRSMQMGGSRIDYTGTDNTWESIQSIVNGASSSMRINNTSASNGTPGTNGIASTNKITLGGTDAGASLLTGLIFEIIIKAGAVSGADQTALYNNAHSAGLA